MKEFLRTNLFVSILAMVFLAAGVGIVKSGWIVPPAAPPTDNTDVLINIGTDYQNKIGPAGDWTAGVIYANDYRIESISRWASELDGTPGCTWQEWKCDCTSEEMGGGGNSGRITLGLRCVGQVITDLRVLNANASTDPDDENCPNASAYPYCSIYTRDGAVTPPPPAPSGLSLLGSPYGGGDLSWSWIAPPTPPSLSNYNFSVQRRRCFTSSCSSAEPFQIIGDLPHDVFIFSLPQTQFPLGTYQYRVKARIGGVFSNSSNCIPGPPAQPTVNCPIN